MVMRICLVFWVLRLGASIDVTSTYYLIQTIVRMWAEEKRCTNEFPSNKRYGANVWVMTMKIYIVMV